jgi:hypothetical protein
MELNPIYHLLALLGAHPILHISRIRANVLKQNYCALVGVIKDWMSQNAWYKC